MTSNELMEGRKEAPLFIGIGGGGMEICAYAVRKHEA